MPRAYFTIVSNLFYRIIMLATFSLLVACGGENVQNSAPIADTGDDRRVRTFSQVYLDGTASVDPDGEIVDYTWVQIAGSPIALNLPNSEKPFFTAPHTAGELSFRLTVTDNKGSKSADTIDIIVFDLVVDAGSTQQVLAHQEVILFGAITSSIDIESFEWTQTQGPPVELANTDTLTPSFIAPDAPLSQALTFTLTATDQLGNVEFAPVAITVDAYPLVADLLASEPVDPVLAACFEALYEASADTYSITSITCDGVEDPAILSQFPNLSEVILPNGHFNSLQTFLALDRLTHLDVTNGPVFSCSEIDQIREALQETDQFIYDGLCYGARIVELGGTVFDSVLDRERGLLFVSVPELNEIQAVSLDSQRIVDRISLPGTPRGIDLSIDNTRLFIALSGSNVVGVFDIDTRELETLALGTLSGHSSTYDVMEVAPDRLLVTSSPSSSGFAWVVQILLDQDEPMMRVANERIVRASPVIAATRHDEFAYIGEGFSPNSLYKLSLLTPEAPIVLEDAHGSVSGTSQLTLSEDGRRIALFGGQVLRTGSFETEGQVAGGSAVRSELGNKLIVASGANLVEHFDFESLELVFSTETECGFSQHATGIHSQLATGIHSFNGDQNYVLVNSSQVCITGDIIEGGVNDPYPDLRFNDLGFERCVIGIAEQEGWVQPGDFTYIDCSSQSEKIRSVEGVELFANITHLNLSNSQLSNIDSLSELSQLQFLSLQNIPPLQLEPLLALGNLVELDLLGSGEISCAQVDAFSHIDVIAPQCAESLALELGGTAFDMAIDYVAGKVYVSLPSGRKVITVDLNTMEVIDSWSVSGEPRGIELAADRETLYVALNGVGDVALLSTDSGEERIIDLSVLLDHDSTYDVAEVEPGRILVSSSPGSGGFAYIVELIIGESVIGRRVAGERIIRARPFFAVAQDSSAVYVGEGFSPNSIYKLDATKSGLPIVLEDNHGEVSGAFHMSLNPDGSRLYTGSGQILDTSTLTVVGQLPAGVSLPIENGEKILISDAVSSTSIGVYDTNSLKRVGQREVGCAIEDVSRIGALSGNGVLVLGSDLLCGSRSVQR